MTLFQFFSKDKKGFTVVELMVTISIIGILSTITFASFSQAQKRSRIAKRVSDLKQMQVAIEYYYAVNRAYPNTSGALQSECAVGGSLTVNNVIPGLVPNYIPRIPTDPKMVAAGSDSCYVYRSNGSDYYIMDSNITEFSSADYLSQAALVDPARDGGSSTSVVDGATPTAWKVYSPGAITW